MSCNPSNDTEIRRDGVALQLCSTAIHLAISALEKRTLPPHKHREPGIYSTHVVEDIIKQLLAAYEPLTTLSGRPLDWHELDRVLKRNSAVD